MKKNVLALLATALFVGPMAANATFVFSDVTVTTNSVSFTINGNMSGYATPAASEYSDQFSLVYTGDLWTGATTFTPNTWSTSVFDNETFLMNGNTGGFGLPYNYSWSAYTSNLSDAFAVNRRVTVNLGGSYLNPLASLGEIRFVWGNGSTDQYQSVLGSTRLWNQTSAPEPMTLGLMGIGMLGVGFMRRRRSA